MKRRLFVSGKTKRKENKETKTGIET